MNRLLGKLPAKIGAVFLSLLCGVIVAASSLGIFAMGQVGVYTEPESMVWRSLVDEVTNTYMRKACEYYEQGSDPAEFFQDTNFRYSIYDTTGKVLSSNESGERYQYTSQISDFQYVVSETDEYGDYLEPTLGVLRIEGSVLEELVGRDRYTAMAKLLDFGVTWRYWLIALDVLAVLLGALPMMFLFCAAGHREGKEGVTLNLVDRVPFDVHTVLLIAIVCAEVAVLDSMYGIYAILVCSGILFVLDFFLLLGYLLSFATRIKAGVLVKQLLVCRTARWLWRMIKAPFRVAASALGQLPLIWKGCLALGIICVLELIFIANCYYSFDLVGFWFLEKLLLIPAAIWFMLALRRLEQAGQKLAAGDLSYRVNTKYLYGDLRTHGEDLNSISQGMTKAVEQRLKSERLKTELITNVSHDIKTPLTSIINYVDLIQKEPIESQTVKEYVEVLARQSARLKKLIEDLVEASKASTGNVSVDMAPVEVGVLLNQTAGEYGEKLEACNLELVINQPGDPVWILADGRHLWRVFDNLMNNVCKYAMAGTRVYLSLTLRENHAVITFRNISKMPLNISGDELVERFVRGDSSRNTEGSGLGLSIARSLTDLQKGQMDIIVDGDLFKVLLTFDRAPEDPAGTSADVAIQSEEAAE